MKSKILALSKKEEFKNLLQKKKISNKYVTVFFGILSNKDDKKLNISFVTKKKIGNAVKRNKIKRRLRNMTKEATNILDINFAYSYLIIAKENVYIDKYFDIKKNLFLTFNKVK